MENSYKKNPSVMKTKGPDRKASKLSAADFFFDDTAEGRISFGKGKSKTMPMVMRPRITKPMTRLDHDQPKAGKALRRTSGKVIPPKEAPAIAAPIARPRRRMNSLPTADIATVEATAEAIPPRTPKQRKVCQ
ncbi:hypothetical protein CaCOL14_005524 [Colletotrichum acutatum]